MTVVRIAVVGALAAALVLVRDVRAGDVPLRGDDAPGGAPAAETPPPAASTTAVETTETTEIVRDEGWTVVSGGRAVGRYAGISGDEGKYREDYDTLETGGGAEAELRAVGPRERYFDLTGSILGQRHGDAVDGGEVHLRTGRWGVYSVRGDLWRTQAFFDDSREGPLRGFPFTNELGRELTSARTTGRLAFDHLFGERGLVGFVYRHRDTGGDRSLIKGSVTESFSPFAFRFPAFERLDVRSDSVDVHAALPAGPVDVRLLAGYTDEHDRTSTHETNFAPTTLRDRTRFDDDVDLQIARAGFEVIGPRAGPARAHAGYRFVYTDADASALQADGATASVLVRTADGISVTERSHTGFAGTVLTPVRHLVARVGYTYLDRNRDGEGSELRRTAPGATTGELVRDSSAKDLRRHRPRVDVSYSGVPRTLLRARYAFEHSDRDLQVRMLAGGDPLDPASRLQSTDEDRDVHVAGAEARVRATSRLLVGAGYGYRREDVDEDVAELVNEVTLGDRTRDRHAVFATGRLRATRATTLELRAERSWEDFERTDGAGDSETSLDGETVSLRAVSLPVSRLALTGLLSYANYDQDVGTPRRRLGTFRPIEFRGRSATAAVSASYSLNARTRLEGQYSVVEARGSLDNLNHRAFVGATRRLTDHLQIGAGYAYLDFDQGLFAGDDFTAHVGWATATLTY